ncbi:MAG: PPE domain-containing protein [Mycolicibacterium sp.]|nr:PPE domain-containing protein [Mycolicibacterium sp.]
MAGPGLAGTATTMVNAAAWQALAVSHEFAFSLSTLNTAVTAMNFEGVGGVSSVAAITALNTSLQLLAGWVQEKPPIAASAVTAYETAVSAMIPAEICIANRTEQAAAVAVNPAVLGALTPAIIALDTEYFGEHWPHNAGIGAAYGAALAALAAALAIPPPISPPGASAAAPATSAAAVAQAAGRVVAGEAMKESGQLAKSAGDGAAGPTEAAVRAGQMMMQPIQAVLGSMQPAVGMFQAPVQAVHSLAGLPQSLAGSLRGISVGGEANATAVPTATPTGAGAAVFERGPGTGVGGTGTAGGGIGALPGGGVTSYSRPSSSFAPEGAGRPRGLQTGLLSAAELHAPATTGTSNSVLPMSPAGAGIPARGKDASNSDGGPRSRIVAEPQTQPGMPR